jgi:hypothetical protein
MAQAQGNHGRRMILELGKRSGCTNTIDGFSVWFPTTLRDPFSNGNPRPRDQAVVAIRDKNKVLRDR